MNNNNGNCNLKSHDFHYSTAPRHRENWANNFTFLYKDGDSNRINRQRNLPIVERQGRNLGMTRVGNLRQCINLCNNNQNCDAIAYDRNSRRCFERSHEFDYSSAPSHTAPWAGNYTFYYKNN